MKIINLKKIILSAAFIFAFKAEVFSESFEFVERDIGEILYAVSLYKGFPVFADDTVSGIGNFRMVGEDFDEDFDAFLNSSRLYVNKTQNRWTVSRIKIQKGENDKFSVDAYDVIPSRLLEAVAEQTGVCVTYENLPQNKVSIHSGFCSIDEIVKRIAGLCPGFETRKEESGFFHVSRGEGASGIGLKNGRAEFTKNDDGSWSCEIQNAPVSVASEKICQLAGKEFCFSLSSDSKILRASFTAKDFDEALSRICVLGGAETCVDGNVYFITSSKNKEKLNESGKSWHSAEVKNLKLQNFLQLASKRFPEIATMAIENGKFIYLASDYDSEKFGQFLKEADVQSESRLVQLKYIRTSEFLKNLPPFIDKNSVFDSGRGDSFYYTGSSDGYENLMKHIGEFDRPVSRVSYDLLIMQYQANDGDKWASALKAGMLSLGDRNSAAANLGSVLDLNLDVVSVFGMKFAASLQAAISSSKAKVFADTTLNGVSGSTISFQNTNTYRYRDNNLDPETGEPIYSGITKEIVSGLKLEVTGVVTGDGMITSKITASVSRQGTDLSSKTGNPPPSSEKVVTTEVRAKSGEPVILSGLIQEEDSESASGVPLLSKIPFLGRLFKSQEKSRERTELVIYLVPTAEIHSDVSNDAMTEKNQIDDEKVEKLKALYEEFVETKYRNLDYDEGV